MSALRSFALAALLAAAPAYAQEHAAPAGEHDAPAGENVDIITPHITDGYHLEIPYWKPPFAIEACIGRHISEHECAPLWDDVRVGPLTLNFSPTKHVVFLLLGATLVSLTLILTARAHARHTHVIGRPQGFAAGIEAMVLYIRNEVIIPNVGHHGNGYVPFLLTAFFFILTANLLGLIPYGSTATGNISVTATLALMTFVVVEIAGMRALGSHYLSTIFYWNKDLALPIRVLMFIIMSPVELIGKFTKPFALAIRLFANMTAGHIVLLAFISLIFTFKSIVSGAPFLMAVAISMLELFVAFLQAFIFTLLSAVFIGQIREAHH
ncbi:MAG: F0F1 ATP synthase subunit A [Gemmatimonadaceae bacterium]|nr:F0F1 ATP synthase subunit A [Gemmatimonadaceae bacterium]